MKTGQYTEYDGDFRFRYLIYKIMKKTVEVSTLISYKYSDWRGERHYRYPLDLLREQIEKCEYIEFKITHNEN